MERRTNRSNFDPLLSATFFEAPIRTILASIEDVPFQCITTHQLQDAYNILLDRLRMIAPSLSTQEQALPALRALTTHLNSLASGLQRDIYRALADLLYVPPGTSSVSQDPSATTLRSATEEATLCQLAVRTTAVIFRFPSLFTSISGKKMITRILNYTHVLLEQVQANLLDSILAIVCASALPCYDANKVIAHATSVFSSIQLPGSVLAPRCQRVTSWMGDLVSSIHASSDHSKVSGPITHVDEK